MEAIFKIEPKDFNEKLFKQLKKLFKDKTVTIAISTDIDETTYLAAIKANEKHLLESMAQEPSVQFTYAEFKETIKKM